MGCGGLVLDTTGAVLGMNDVATRILEAEDSPRVPAQRRPGWSREALKKILARAGSRFRVDQESWITVSHPDGAPLVLHAIPLEGEVTLDGSGQLHTMLVMVDLSERPKPTAGVLQRLFDLTPAEAKLAIEIGSGKTLSEVADSTGLSSATLRTQLSSVFNKTSTRRQPELVALLARVAILP